MIRRTTASSSPIDRLLRPLRKVIALGVLLLAAAAATGAPAHALVGEGGGGTAWIASDKDDYPPGAEVTLTGGNWSPGERVHIWVDDDQTKTWERNVDVVADASGAIVDKFNLPDWFVATYKVKATGESGTVAETGFTDANVSFALANSSAKPSSWTVSWRVYSNSACTTQVSGTDGQGSATYDADGVLISGRAAPVSRSQYVKATGVTTTASNLDFKGWSTAATDIAVLAQAPCVNGENNGAGAQTYAYAHFRSTKQATSLTAESASGTYGGTATLSAALGAGTAGVSGKTISFSLNGTSVGTAVTNASGVATLSNAALAGIEAGSYPAGTNSGVSAAFAGDASHVGSTASNSLTVGKKTLTGTFRSADRVYDGTTGASVTERALVGVIGQDVVSLDGGTASFADKYVGSGKTVKLSGASLIGADADNYSLDSVATTTAAITARELTGSFTAADKVYDGSTVASIVSRSVRGKVGSEDVSLSGGSASFADKNAGTGKDVMLAGATLAGADAGNYSLGSVESAKADITARELTGTFTAADKVYDGDDSASIVSRSVSGKVGSEDVTLSRGSATFASKDVGSQTVTGTDFELAGAAKGNYSLKSSTLETTAAITARELTGSFTAADKVYDGSKVASIVSRSVSGQVGSEDVTLSRGSATFASKDVGSQTVTGTDFELAGAGKGNYSLKSSTLETTATITAKELTATFTAADKIYDGGTDATISSSSLGTGMVDGDAVRLDDSDAKAQFANANVGNGKAVTASRFKLAGTDGGNYSLTMGTTTAAITPLDITGSFTAADKVYDGHTAATITGRSVSGQVAGDAVDLTGGSSVFADRHVGQDKVVTGSGFALGGADQGNYSLRSATLTTEADITPKEVTGSFKAADKIYDGTTAATITERSLSGVVAGDMVALIGGTATFANPNVGQNKPVTGVGLELGGSEKGNYSLKSSTLSTTASITYGWTGFLQPINDTAHQTGASQSRFRLGQTVPAKFHIKDAAGNVVQQVGDPTFTRSGNRGTCDTSATLENTVAGTPTSGSLYKWDGSQYHYNWNTKGLSTGLYRIYANLADGTARWVDICLMK